MDDQQLLDRVTAAKNDFGAKCSKYAGAVTVELMRRAFEERGIKTSARDVFIHGVPVEIDLLIAKSDAVPVDDLLYQPHEVLVAFEIKNSGSFGDSTIQRTRHGFDLIQSQNPKIHCAYVTLAERKEYLWAIDDATIGGQATAATRPRKAYTLFRHNESPHNRTYEPTGDWERLIADVKSWSKVIR